MHKVVLDIDGCLANFNHGYGDLLIKLEGDKLPEDWKTNPEWPPVWFWDRDAGYSKETEEKAWDTITSDPKFWQTLEPLEGAREVLMNLNGQVKAGKIEVYFITHRPGVKAKLQTENWLYDHGIDFPTVLIASNKVPFLQAIKANFFEDDKAETVQDVSRASRSDEWPDFKLYLKMAPYNKAIQGGTGYKGAVSVKDALIDTGLWD